MKRTSRPSQARKAPQRGVVLIFALITLVILLIGAVAISRSIGSSQLSVGNIGFRRDMVNQGERVVQIALEAARTGALANATTRLTNLPAANYSATLLPSNAQGIPNALLNDTDFAAVATAPDISVPDLKVDIRYVIDRIATATGSCAPTTCTQAQPRVAGGGSSQFGMPNSIPQPIYRITMRVRGPRNTLAFYQSTFTY